ncbi:hypothetical protein [Kitasatospora sp. GAS1066B]|uniref:hypothetical protein n=1 Tax=Kitasatospora sp. GAS1066B TaxID=3156271 RepID=UPI003513BC32
MEALIDLPRAIQNGFRERRNIEIRELEDIVDRQRAKVSELSSLDTETRARIGPAVATAYLTTLVDPARGRSVKNFALDHEPLIVRTVLLLGLFSFWGEHQKYFYALPQESQTSILIVVALAFFVTRFVFSVLDRASRWLAYLWRLCLVASAALLLRYRDGWMKSVHESGLLVAGRRWPNWKQLSISTAELDRVFVVSLSGVLAMALLPLVSSVSDEIVGFIRRRVSTSTASCARMIQRLFELALLAEREGFESGDTESQRSLAFGNYLAGRGRLLIVDSLESLARFSETQWKNSILTGDRVADYSVVRLADGVAAAARSWKREAATGISGLDHMRESFAVALVDAVDGRWGALAIDTVRESRLTKALRSLRRLVAIAIVLAAGALTILHPFEWTRVLSGASMGPIFMIVAGGIAIVVDPSVGDRISAAAKVTGGILKN